MPNIFRLPLTGHGTPFAMGVVLTGAAQCATAHALDVADSTTDLRWSFDALVMSLLALSAVLYGLGYHRLLGRSKLGRRIRRSQGACFVGGWLTLLVALVSPLDALGGALFSAHMVQHELLMLVAAPLLVLGRPLAVWLWAFGPSGRAAVARTLQHGAVRFAWGWLTLPTVAWLLHALALWAWHVPRWFEAALRHPTLHTLQHGSFLLSALLFWWTILGVRRAGSGSAHAMLSLFTTMVHTGALGALLTLSPGLWYPSYFETSAALGFDPWQDQQLGGLVMWVPGGIAYVAAGLVVAARWLARGEKGARSDPHAVPSP